MDIVQIVTELIYGDAIGNDVLAIDRLLKGLHIKTKVYCLRIDKRIPDGVAEHCDHFPSLREPDIILYHYAGAEFLRELIEKQHCRKIMVYHNWTPASFFVNWQNDMAVNMRKSQQELLAMCNDFELCIADSEFNRRGLLRAGYRCPVIVLPIIVQWEDYDQTPDEGVLQQFAGDGWTNILFVGRIVPNKSQEDVIRSFACYQKMYNQKSRLFLVGNPTTTERYDASLKKYVETIGAKNVYFTGHIDFPAILSYYHLADLFLCMSEHEGFCVPILEAMKFKVPIIAYDSCAVPETLGGAGIVVEEKDERLIAKLIDSVVRDKDLASYLRRKEELRLMDFSYESMRQKYQDVFDSIIDRKEILSLESAPSIEPDKRLVHLVREAREDVQQEGGVKEVPFFPRQQEVIPVSKWFMVKRAVRKRVLKPAYWHMHAVFPKFADLIRKAIE